VASSLRPLWPGSDPQALNSWREIGDDIIRTMDSERISGIIGMGHSLGAVATMYAALKRPDLFRALVLIEPVFLPAPVLDTLAQHPNYDQIETPLVRSALYRRYQWVSRDEAFSRFRSKAVFERLSDSALWDYVNAATVPDGDLFTLAYPREWEARIYALPPLDVWQRVAELTQPTLALRGALTDTITPESWQLWQVQQPAATFVELPAVGHLLPLEQPARVAEVFFEWLVDQNG
jgi:pimeloyl-ACP methyl ester carboxylesterase